MDNLDQHILLALLKTEKMRMRWSDLVATIWKYGQQENLEFDTLGVYIARNLGRLVDDGLLKKERVSHKMVFYYIPKRNHRKVMDKLGEELGISFADALRPIRDFLKIISRPESLDDLKKAHYETDRIFRAKLSSFDASASSFEEFAALSKETTSSILVSALRQIYGLYVDVTGWGKEEATLIGFTEGGGFYLTPASKLIGGSIREGQDMSWRTVKAVFRLEQKRLREEKEKNQKQEGSS